MSGLTRKCNDWLARFMQLTEDSEPPEAFRKWTGISVLASALQRKCVLQWGHLELFPNMYIVLVGPPASRKGTAMQFGSYFVRQLGIPLASDVVTKEKLIIQMDEAAAISSDGTVHFQHSSLTIYQDELTVFLGYNNAELISILCKWFDCVPFEYKTKHKVGNVSNEQIIPNPFANLMGATTPESLESSMPRDTIGGGLSSRIVFVSESKRGKWVPLPVWGKDELEIQSDLMHDLQIIYGMCGHFRCTPAFGDVYSEWYVNQEKHTPLILQDPLLQGYAARRQVHLLKLCMILNASRSNGMRIDEHDFEKARQELEKVERNMGGAFAGMGRSQHNIAMQAIRRTMQKEDVFMSEEELLHIHMKDVDKDTFRKIMATMVLGKTVLVMQSKEVGADGTKKRFYKYTENSANFERGK